VPTEKATALVLRTTDWSETSRIATLWTREFGKVRALAKGGRRLKSNFESSLDLLTVCSIVLLRKSSGSLDLLTEARVVQRFPRLRSDLSALYAGYYIAELLSDLTQDNDPHPSLFDGTLRALADLGKPEMETGTRLARWELGLLRELGFSPVLDRCAVCAALVTEENLVFSASAGGVLCVTCRAGARDRRALAPGAWQLMRALREAGEAWRQPWESAVRAEVRQVLGQYVTYLLGRRPRVLPYLGG
jgi:DNA repair protein RecO (recombination protein O)